MNRRKLKLRPEVKKLVISLLGIAVTMQLIGNNMMFAMAEDSTPIATYEVGVEGSNVIATLTKDGTMTLSGEGDIKDYTAETMPFKDNISNIKDIVIEEGITSVGNALFYNCKDVTGKLIVPSTVVEIGAYAFSGDSYESAPKITKIENNFTQSNIVIETPVEKKAEETTTKESTEEQAAPTVEEPVTNTTPQEEVTKQEEQPVLETVKTVKAITEQQIGDSIFVIGQNGGYSCAETNKSFVNAVKDAGYVRADRFVLVKMDNSITKEVPVVNGQLVLPNKPDTLGTPAEDELTTYQFAGWGVEGSDKVLTPKENYSISDNVDELSLTSQWQQSWKINPQVKAEAKDDISQYSIIDSNTGKPLNSVNGYTIAVQWQINKKDKEDEKSWEDIEKATSFTYERKTEAEDTTSYFRAKLSISKYSNSRSTQQYETIATTAISGVSASKSITISYDNNGGTGTMTSEVYAENSKYKPSNSALVAPSGKVFTGWKVTTISNVKAIYPTGTKELAVGDVIKPDNIDYTLTLVNNVSIGNIQLTAQWDTYTVIYVDQTTGDENNTGDKESPVKTLEKAFSLLPESGTVDTNIIEIKSNYYQTSTSYYGWPDTTSNGRNVTIRGSNKDVSLKFTVGFHIKADTKFQNITIDSTVRSLYFGMNNNNLIFDKGTSLGDTIELTTGDEGGGLALNCKNVDAAMGRYGGAGSGAPSNVTGKHGYSADDPTVLTINTDDVGIARLAGDCRCQGYLMSNSSSSKPMYIVMNFNAGKQGSIGMGCSATGTTYGSAVVNVSGNADVYALSGSGQQSNGTYYGGTVEFNITGGSVEYIYGGGLGKTGSAYVDVHANVFINVTSGSIGKLYGGGASARLYGNANINIAGDAIINELYGGGYGHSEFNLTSKLSNYGLINGDITLNISGGTILNNVYCGGVGHIQSANSGRTTGNIKLNLNGGTINGDIYVAGKGVTDAGFETLGRVEGSVNANISDGIIKGNIYSGGEIGQLLGTSTLTITGGSIGTESDETTGNIFGAGNSIGVPYSNIIIDGSPVITGNIFGGSNAKGTTGESKVTIKGTVNSSIYAGGNGAGATVTTSTVNIESTANVTGNVFGGGELGAVGTSNVNLNGGIINGNVFGGGNNVGVTTSNVNLNGAVALSNTSNAIFGGSNAKGTTENANVIIKAKYISSDNKLKNIYGGGLGSETTVTDSTVNLETGSVVYGDIYGGGKEGKVVNTIVNLNGGESKKNIFGGGHLAGVENSVKINSKNGSKAQNVFGGSNENGSVSNPIITIEGRVISVYGGGKGSGTVTDNPSIIVSKSTSYTPNIYGGGLEGITKIKSKVTLTQSAGSVIQLFGGGQRAGVEGDTEVVIEEGCYAMSVYGGSWVSGEVTGTANVNIAGTSDNVFGGGQGEETLVQNTNVVTSTTSEIVNVYGGSDNGIIGQNTELEIDGTISEGVYGAGKGASSNVNRNTHVVIFGATIGGNVFGGGSQGNITGDSHVDLLSGVVAGSAFGGSDQAKVHGNSKVHMGYNAATNQKEPAIKKMVITKSVYGGGNTTDSGKAFDATNPFVLGNSEVIIDQTGYPSDDTSFVIGEDILGDGNMCVTAGNKTIEIREMRDRDTTKKLNSIQRADTVILNSVWLELSGAKDSANLLPTVLYSMSRIETLRMEGNVSLDLQRSVNLVRNLESYFNGYLVDAMDATGAGGNTLKLQQGTGFELRTNEDVSRPGYGNVKGYIQLNRYDKDNKPVTDGVYVLGGYDISSNSGFVFGQDVYETKPDGSQQLVNRAGDVITPETDGKSWNNWRLGRRVDVREITLTVSDRPSYGKTEAVMSTWTADGSIYRVDKNSLQITNQNGNTEGFSFVNPEGLNTETNINNIFGLEISTGQNGWLEQKTVGHIEGSTTGTGNKIVLTEDYDMISVEDSKVQPLINVSLSNLTGITKSDSNVPLLVTFDVNTYTKQADGTEMKTGTMTIKVNIIRDASAAYSDTTLEAGKNYTGAIQTYEYGTTHETGLTISQGSTITLQYARKASTGTSAPTKHELSFSTALPAGTKITMIDRSTSEAKYYHYNVTSNVTKIGLSEFIKNDTSSIRYTPITSGNAAENYIFIFDFSNASSYSNTAVDAALTAYNNATEISTKHIVFGVNGEQRVYTLSSLKDSADTFTKYSIGSTIPIDLSTAVDVTGLDGVDTTGRDKQMGARVRLYSVDNNSYINIPSTWEVISHGTHYAAGGNNFTINLSDGLTVTKSDIYIQMSSIGNLPIGKYRLDIDLISGALANYPEDDSALSSKTIHVGIELTDYSYSIKSEMTDKNRQLFSNTDTNKALSIKLDKTTSSGATTEGVYVRQTLYKKDEDTGEYTAVDLTELFDSTTLPAAKTKIPWNKNQLDYKYKNSITAGTYRLKFDIMQVDAFNDLSRSEDIVRATDMINIVVTEE